MCVRAFVCVRMCVRSRKRPESLEGKQEAAVTFNIVHRCLLNTSVVATKQRIYICQVAVCLDLHLLSVKALIVGSAWKCVFNMIWKKLSLPKPWEIYGGMPDVHKRLLRLLRLIFGYLSAIYSNIKLVLCWQALV